MSNKELQGAYYNRVMSKDFENIILKDYQWLINYVKNDKELDFQTGFDQKQKKSWFSVYRGTSRILQITYYENSKKIKIDAADAYKELDTQIFKSQHVDEKMLAQYLVAIRENPRFGRYYIDSKGIKKEGYYQTLISRRYTFENAIDDDFIIFDKEFVIGFRDEDFKKKWNEGLVKIQEKHLDELRKTSSDKLPEDIKLEYGEFDFMGLTWDGDLIIMELKKDASNGLSPIQIAYYDLQFSKLLSEGMVDQLDAVIKSMIEQKRRMGLIKRTPKAKELPKGLSGVVKLYIIIGNEKNVSKTIKNRFAITKKAFKVEGVNVFTCEADGTLRPSAQFK